METLLTFLLAGAITLFFVRGYLRKLTTPKAARTADPVAPRKLRSCPRCSQPMEQGSAFCRHCGAAMAMWTVHDAAAQSPGTGDKPSGAARPERDHRSTLRREVAGDVEDQLGEPVGIRIHLSVSGGHDCHVGGDPTVARVQRGEL